MRYYFDRALLWSSSWTEDMQIEKYDSLPRQFWSPWTSVRPTAIGGQRVQDYFLRLLFVAEQEI
jgi:hypothetical protein